MKRVVLAEKPSQAKSYAEAFDNYKTKKGYYEVNGLLNGETVITYGVGHLVELYSPAEYKEEWKKWNLNSLPIFPEEYKFKVSKGKTEQYNIVKKQLDSADEIIIATDSDREGEAIARLIIRLSGNSNKSLKRLWINSLETEEIKKGFRDLKDGKEYYSMFQSAETRQIADWLVGMNLTQLYTLNMQKKGLKGVFSVGRVQTPTLFMIYLRNNEIDNFVSKPFYELYANFEHEKGNYTGKYKERFDTKEEIDKLKEDNDFENTDRAVIKNKETKEKKQYAPKLFALSDLQTYANKHFKYSASKTLSIAQKLYEKKVLSYPRSDSNFIGTPEFNYLKDNLDKYLSLNNIEIQDPQLIENKRYVDTKKVQEHYAIIPTRTIADLNNLTEDESNIYLSVMKRTLAIFEKPFIYDETIIETAINNIIFETKGRVVKERGWKKILQENKQNNDKTLPDVKVNEKCLYQLKEKEGKTQPPKHYTEGTLLTAMKYAGRTVDSDEDKEILKETEGIGTEATRASIIETLKNKEYIKDLKGKLLVTEKGKLLCEIIKDDEISNASMTATWEKYLKQIQEQKGTQKAFLESIERFIEHLISKVPENFEEKDTLINNLVQEEEKDKIIGVCPKCDNTIVDKGKFYGCNGYQEGCKFTLPKKWSSKTIPKSNVKQLINKGITSEIKGFKSKKGYKFNAKLKLENKKITFIFDKE